MDNLLLIASIFFAFSVALFLLWKWFVKNEAEISNKITGTGIKIYKQGKFSEAEKYFTRAINTFFKNFKAHYYLGLANLKQKKYENAKKCFEKVIKHQSKNLDAKFWLAFAQQELNETEQAEIMYKAILKEKPAYADCFLQLGIIEFEKKNFFQAIDYFKKAEKISTKKVMCAFYITKCKDNICQYETKDDGKEIIDDYLKIMQEPDLPESFFVTLANAYAKTGQIEETIEYCQKSLERNSEDFESYKLLSLVQLIKHDWEGVKSTLSTAISLRPDNVEVHELLSYALCRQETICEVEKCREKYAEIIKKFVKPKLNTPDNV